MYIMVRETTRIGMWCAAHVPIVYLGQTRAKKVSDLKEYDVVITTHAVRLFPNYFVADSEPRDQTLVSEWHNANFEEVWAKKKTNAYRRKSRSNGFIVDDEDGDAALKKAIKKKKNKSSTYLYTQPGSERLTVLQPESCMRLRFEHYRVM